MSSPTQPLTPREQQVAQAYAQGGTYRAIAAQLVIAPSTVRAHLGAIYRKLGVGTKVALARALAAPQPGAAKLPTITVLPFGEADDEGRGPALADALTEGVSASLSRFRGLVVVARGAAPAAPPQALAQALGVRYLITGSVRRADGRLRVAAELLDAASGRQLAVQRLERPSADLFDLLDDLTRTIVAALAPEVEAHEIERAARRPTADLGAWELCCRGLRLFPTPDRARLAEARACFEQAMLLDPTFAAPVAHLARAHFYEVIAGDAADPPAAIARGLALARAALALDAREDGAWLALAYCLTLAGDPAAARAAVEQGLQLNPNHGGLYNARALAQLFSPDGDLARVIDDELTALRLNPNDPLRWTAQATIGWALLAGDAPEAPLHALEWLQRADTAPHADWHVPMGRALACLALGDRAQAERQVQAARTRRAGLTLPRIQMALGPLLLRSPALTRGLDGLTGLGLPAA